MLVHILHATPGVVEEEVHEVMMMMMMIVMMMMMMIVMMPIVATCWETMKVEQQQTAQSRICGTVEQIDGVPMVETEVPE